MFPPGHGAFLPIGAIRQAQGFLGPSPLFLFHSPIADDDGAVKPWVSRPSPDTVVFATTTVSPSAVIARGYPSVSSHTLTVRRRCVV